MIRVTLQYIHYITVVHLPITPKVYINWTVKGPNVTQIHPYLNSSFGCREMKMTEDHFHNLHNLKSGLFTQLANNCRVKLSGFLHCWDQIFLNLRVKHVNQWVQVFETQIVELKVPVLVLLGRRCFTQSYMCA